jgi:hypothetical protein
MVTQKVFQILVKQSFFLACLLTLPLRHKNEDLEYKRPIQSSETSYHHVERSHFPWFPVAMNFTAILV